jgi:hypothetical protein
MCGAGRAPVRAHLVVEQDAIDGKHVVGLPVVDRDPERKLLCDGVRGPGVEGRGLLLGHLLHQAVQLAGGGLEDMGRGWGRHRVWRGQAGGGDAEGGGARVRVWQEWRGAEGPWDGRATNRQPTTAGGPPGPGSLHVPGKTCTSPPTHRCGWRSGGAGCPTHPCQQCTRSSRRKLRATRT